MRRLGAILAIPLLLAGSLATANAKEIARWTRFEAQFPASAEYANPVQDVQLNVQFTSPSVRKHTVPAFWDGAKTWKVRFAPDETGKWSLKTSCSNQTDKRLPRQAGEFTCVPYSGKNPLYRHGTIRPSANRLCLEHADGTPFFWL